MSSLISPTSPVELRGLWRRSLISWPDGRRDTTSRVRWLQGESLFADLRQPADLGAFAHVRALADLTPQDCAALARQEGFAGRLTRAGDFFEWRRVIDFQPPSPFADAGSLRMEGSVLVERGRDVGYVEHWHRDAPAPRAAAAVVLRDPLSGVDAVLLRVGDDFMFARDRPTPLTGRHSLADCVAGAAAERARELIDCEISIGMAGTGGFCIGASSLPHRVGERLVPRPRGHALEILDRHADGQSYGRRFDIVEFEGDLAALQG